MSNYFIKHDGSLIVFFTIMTVLVVAFIALAINHPMIMLGAVVGTVGSRVSRHAFHAWRSRSSTRS